MSFKAGSMRPDDEMGGFLATEPVLDLDTMIWTCLRYWWEQSTQDEVRVALSVQGRQGCGEVAVPRRWAHLVRVCVLPQADLVNLYHLYDLNSDGSMDYHVRCNRGARCSCAAQAALKQARAPDWRTSCVHSHVCGRFARCLRCRSSRT